MKNVEGYNSCLAKMPADVVGVFLCALPAHLWLAMRLEVPFGGGIVTVRCAWCRRSFRRFYMHVKNARHGYKTHVLPRYITASFVFVGILGAIIVECVGAGLGDFTCM